MIKNHSSAHLKAALFRVLDELDPSNTIVHFWPPTPASTVSAVQARGFITIREMINCFRGTAKHILDDAYEELNIPIKHNIDEDSVEAERAELAIYDYIFASNAQVEISLVDAGIGSYRILPSSFGWTPSKYRFNNSERPNRSLTVLFVGTIGVRKGIPFLLRAWAEGEFDGKLILAGGVEEGFGPTIDRYKAYPNIEFVEFVSDLSYLYNTADIFVFPTLEEGGPQVVYEAAGAGLPTITTPMGAGRIVKHGQNGLIVPPADAQGLAFALHELASDPLKRRALGKRAAMDAMDYTYEKISLQRQRQMLDLLL
jgi:glycosyltransferase involved in cell wall biosynthesis